MVNEVRIGGFAISKAGHDFGKSYVIFDIEDEYVYLVDGKIRTLDRPKKKKVKHVELLEQMDHSLKEKILDSKIKNEEIKRALKLLQSRNSSKEVN